MTSLRLLLPFSLLVSLSLPDSVAALRAGEVTANVGVSGLLYNQARRQHLSASFEGRGRHRPSRARANLRGTVKSEAGTRIPSENGSLFGDYPAVARVGVRTPFGNVSERFRATVTLRRRAIVVEDYGRIRLNRAIKPNKPGRQRFGGSGTLTVKTRL